MCVCVRMCLIVRTMHVCDGGRFMLATPNVCNYYLLLYIVNSMNDLYKDNDYSKLIQK